jgi:hypothetical protein
VIDECGECDGPGPMLGYTCEGTPELFVYNSSMQQAFYFFTIVMIDSMIVDPNDWVGAFNGEVCVGAKKWDTSQCGGGTCDVPILGDDGLESSEGYMLYGEIPTFKIYDDSEGTYYDAVASEEFPWLNLAMNMIDSLSAIAASIDYCLSLHSGANLKSFYALPEDNSLSNILSSIEQMATGIITEGGAASQNGPGNWVGSLTNIFPEKGYWIIVQSDANLCLEDALLSDPETEYNLHAGANLISFPLQDTVVIGYALPDDIEGSVSGIITEGGAASQNSPGNWVGSLTAFNGGEGYWMIASESISFSFDLTSLGR